MYLQMARTPVSKQAAPAQSIEVQGPRDSLGSLAHTPSA